jgi:hypothetical protein
LEGENAIIIPIHYQDNHWITVTRRNKFLVKLPSSMLTISTAHIPPNILNQHFAAESRTTALCPHLPNGLYASNYNMINTSWNVAHACCLQVQFLHITQSQLKIPCSH